MTAATTIATLNATSPPPALAELVPQYYDPDQIVTPPDNPVYTPAVLAGLLESIRQYGQLVPGFVSPSPDLPDGKLMCDEGNRRLAVVRLLGLRFWGFNAGRVVKEAERIRLKFHHHASRRRMTLGEVAGEGGRYMVLTGCTQAEAAKQLGVSEATLSRAFGDQRILPHLKERAELLLPSIRSLVASAPAELMEQVLDYAETPGSNGRLPIRDHVAMFIRQEKKKANARPKGRKPEPVAPETITLKINGRTLTFSVGEADSAFTVAEDLKAIADKLRKKELADVPPKGWPFLFQ